MFQSNLELTFAFGARERKIGEFATLPQPLGYVTNFKNRDLTVGKIPGGIMFLETKFNN